MPRLSHTCVDSDALFLGKYILSIEFSFFTQILLARKSHQTYGIAGEHRSKATINQSLSGVLNELIRYCRRRLQLA